MKVGSGVEHRTKLKANKIVAIIFENLLHNLVLVFWISDLVTSTIILKHR